MMTKTRPVYPLSEISSASSVHASVNKECFTRQSCGLFFFHLPPFNVKFILFSLELKQEKNELSAQSNLQIERACLIWSSFLDAFHVLWAFFLCRYRSFSAPKAGAVGRSTATKSFKCIEVVHCMLRLSDCSPAEPLEHSCRVKARKSVFRYFNSTVLGL